MKLSILLFAALAPFSVPRPPQEPRPPRQADAPESGPAPEGAAQGPFELDAKLSALLGGQTAETVDFEVLGERPPLPEMRLRGLVRMKGRTRYAALIELDGIGTFTRREGERLSFTLRGQRVAAVPAPGAPSAAAPAARPGVRSAPAPTQRMVAVDQPIVMRIAKVSTDGVLVEVGSLGQYLVIR